MQINEESSLSMENPKINARGNSVIPKFWFDNNMSSGKNLWIVSFTPVHKEPRVLRQIDWANKNGYRVFLFGYGDAELVPRTCYFVKLDLAYDYYEHKVKKTSRFIWPFKVAVSINQRFNRSFFKLIYLLIRSIVNKVPSRAIRKYLAVKFFEKIPVYVSNEKVVLNFLKLNPQYAPDHIFCHDYFTMKIGVALKKQTRAKLNIDCHEYAAGQYSHLPGWNKNTRPQIIGILDKYLPLADTVTSVCDGISDLLTQEHNLQKPVATIRSMPFKNIQNFRPTGDKINILYHGEIYESRGLHQAVRALADCDTRFNLTIRGYSDPEYVQKLNLIAKDYGVMDRFKIEPPVPFNEIIPAANAYDIGYFVHEDTSPQRRFTLPNKFFEYIMAGLALCVSDLPEMSAIVKRYDLGMLVKNYDPSNIAQVLNCMNKSDIDHWKKNAIQAAEELNWEREAKRLGDLIGG